MNIIERGHTWIFLILFDIFLSTYAQKECQTPYKRAGNCIWAEDCPPINKILNNAYRKRSDSKFIKDSHCQTVMIDKKPKLQVCCDKNIAQAGCTLPEYPNRGSYKIDGEIMKVGIKVPVSTVLTYECEKNYAPYPQDVTYCQNDFMWDKNITCLISISEEDTRAPSNSPSTPMNVNYNSENTCVVPPFPQKGKFITPYAIYSQVKPGDLVLTHGVLKYECEPNYTPWPIESIYCKENKRWSDEIKCVKTCEILIAPTLELICHYKGVRISCESQMLDGTIVTTKCKPGHKEVANNRLKTLKCVEGEWDRSLPKCVAECGEINPNPDEKISPWFAGIYEFRDSEFTFICGATVLTNKILLSVAHCFYDFATNSVKKNTNFSIAVGKYYEKWDHIEEHEHSYVQKSKISQIIVTDNADFSINYFNDISMLILEKELIFSTSVHPVCYDGKDRAFYSEQLSPGTMGTIHSWGFVKKGNDEVVTDTLLKNKLPVIDMYSCSKSTSADFLRKIVIAEKFCAGYLNGTGMCAGSSGGGFIIPKTENNITKYYIRGVLSLSPLGGSYSRCPQNVYSFYTNLWSLKYFIKDVLDEY